MKLTIEIIGITMIKILERGNYNEKEIVLILATLMCISLCACGGSESTSNSENKVVEQNDDKGAATENNSEVVENTEIIFSELEKNGNDIGIIEVVFKPSSSSCEYGKSSSYN